MATPSGRVSGRSPLTHPPRQRRLVGTNVGLDSLKINHMFDSLHSDPRFKDLVRRIGLPE